MIFIKINLKIIYLIKANQEEIKIKINLKIISIFYISLINSSFLNFLNMDLLDSYILSGHL